MPLVVDEVLELPLQFLGLIFNTVIQTAYKTAWANYRRELHILMIRLKRDYYEGRISKEEMEEVQSRIFAELRIAKRALGSSTG